MACFSLVLGGLLFLPLGFVLVTTTFAVFGVWEIFRALEVAGTRLPIVPVMSGTVAMPLAAYFGGLESLLFAMLPSSVAVLLWRSLESAAGSARSIFAGVFTLAWVPFLISFADAAAARHRWPDAGGPVARRRDSATVRGRSPRCCCWWSPTTRSATWWVPRSASIRWRRKSAPRKPGRASPDPSAAPWSIGVLACLFLLDKPWWVGVVLAVGMVAAATAGDLAESMVKRELGIKDMSSILPGHGGVMDRLDSIVFASPVAFILFSAVAGSLRRPALATVPAP